jgi:hypothetical protein
LNDGKSFRHTFIDAALREFDAAAVDALLLRQELQQAPSPQPTSRTRAGRDHLGDDGKIETRLIYGLRAPFRRVGRRREVHFEFP